MPPAGATGVAVVLSQQFCASRDFMGRRATQAIRSPGCKPPLVKRYTSAPSFFSSCLLQQPFAPQGAPTKRIVDRFIAQ